MSDINLNKSVDEAFAGIVSVSRFGDDQQDVRIEGPTTIAQCLARAGVEVPLPKGQSVSVNGAIVNDLSAPVEPGAIIVVASRISNG